MIDKFLRNSTIASMKKLSGGQAAVESLKAEKVEHVFGLIGSATMEMFDALYDAADINFIGVRDERTGASMADGYARASGRPGVILAGQNGPGATNLVSGLAQAAAAFSPVVSIAGSLSSGHVHRDAVLPAARVDDAGILQHGFWRCVNWTEFMVNYRTAFRGGGWGCAGHLRIDHDERAVLHAHDDTAAAQLVCKHP